MTLVFILACVVYAFSAIFVALSALDGALPGTGDYSGWHGVGVVAWVILYSLAGAIVLAELASEVW